MYADVQLADPRALVFSAAFFALLALFAGIAVYVSLVRISARRERFRHWPEMRKPMAAFIAVMIFLLVLLGVYFDAIHGFHRLQLQGEQVRLYYLFPRGPVIVRRSEIAEVARVPANRGAWRVKLYTQSGQPFASAQTSYGRARETAARVEEWRKR